MRNYNDIVNQVLDEVKKRAKQTANPENYLPWWLAWYNGYVRRFHHYFVYNGKERVWYDKKQLNMAKRGCEDWASLLNGEKTQIVISNDNDKFQELLESVNFHVKTTQALEFAFALSYAGICVDFENLEANENGNLVKNKNTKVLLNFYDATKCVPITFENREVVECAFVSVNTQHTDINLHLRDENGNYEIVLYRMSNETGQKSSEITTISTNSKKPFFTIIHPNIANNKNINYPYPLSIYANAIDVLKSLDNAYDAFDNEIQLGRKRLFISAELNKMEYGDDGEARIKSVFDPNDSLIYGLPGGTGKDEKPVIYSASDPLRIDSLVMALNYNLKLFSSKIGLGNDYYNFDKTTGAITATQVISEKSDTFRNLQKHQQIVRKCFADITEALIYANNEFTMNAPISMERPQVLFDDSIIEDKKSEQERDDKNLLNGSMSLVEYRMKWFGEDEEKAKESVYNINGRTDLVKRLSVYLEAYNSGLMTPEMFVNLAYTDDDLKACGTTKEQLIASLKENKTSVSISADDLNGFGGYDPLNNPNTNEE